ncbi:MAG TPA: glycosyl transferase [Marinilabiliales bacterium]|nr:MAG: glycosyl transferase [Bacteroidetes bacterium GWA2_40_14]OFX57341.1 MAG: glycosyl transferase [Bacteroidetes bacterium GWC2_40_13]OFX76208.1 MAG: glycosyl transferase [Bacteroidetes bacterium GWD2_40_43]OFX95343.1 MAG: glycosyl transferase [Bacteroidetes bacterium GWE2_40_63]OFY19007.1 MAG: glycosyl transferase [Bacteroidetes bacterium GWF2_40_13]OFZ24011.1 MAG: glycosyl transferase [Bacteroidetes bacterium RIFOXYC2_FULL_40_12]HAN00127.1 glycosyl transferase [Marinilabiliales bacteriu
MKTINCFIPYTNPQVWTGLLESLQQHANVETIYLISPEEAKSPFSKCRIIKSKNIFHTQTIQSLAALANADYTLLITRETEVNLGQFALERFLSIADATGASMVYSDYIDLVDGKAINHPVIDYQMGSLRDDFNFGPLLFINSKELKKAIGKIEETFEYAGLYQLRLALSQAQELFHLPEYLYSIAELDNRESGKKIFDYVNPKNRNVQIEMEKAATSHLKAIGGYLHPEFTPVEFGKEDFPVEASVIIPVRNREKTIADAIESVMKQKAPFAFNLIIVDNHSTDRTTEIIKQYASKFPALIHIIPDRTDLGIGGCWNLAAHAPQCGKFAIQLDSDDLYKDETTLTQVVDAFYKEKCAMVVGSYQMTNFKLEEIPPGLIDHKEWTPDNGRNNALRINGLGAPRAFYTPVLRDIKIPNVSYGEDYGLGLAISRKYQIGRIYNPIYLCRRWDENSDASLSIEAMNKHNFYKDKLRTMELKARIRMNETK